MNKKEKSKLPENSSENTPDETHLKAGMLARAFMGLPSLSEEELAKRARMAERVMRK